MGSDAVPDSSLDRRLALSIFTVDNVQWQLTTAPNSYLCYPAYFSPVRMRLFLLQLSM
ncbi:hypothetical protein K435DRAFT_775962 [Dendrothele bispora CBS 962.96]|uniref:Uncharacterized protein n=1 Tax=Dendrothele bispora (strain CBS 962.96) TaxID=1314807 RepID=A0A4S8MHC0_DENBC|nr:hypothetical protein K435DRAFT_775962 [Dendrothele bispora CBS 962.96]